MKTVVQKLDIKLKDNPLTEQIKFPFDGLCSITLIGSAPFSYQFHSIDTDTWYSDKPLLCRNKKELLPFGSYKGRIFSFEFKNAYQGNNTVTLHAEYSDKSFNDKEYSFREYTLDGLNRKSSVVIEAGQEAEVFLTNFRGGYYESGYVSSWCHGYSDAVEVMQKPISRQERRFLCQRKRN